MDFVVNKNNSNNSNNSNNYKFTYEIIMTAIKSLSIFLLAGLCEIGGGYLVWLWLKEDKPFWYGLLGGFIHALYGVVATLQTSNFARVYATYGGIFIVLSLL